MKKIIFTLFVFLGYISTSSRAQNSHALDAMRQDYPGLMSIYGDRISSQKAHYIFVVDVSSSMLPYENTVKNNFLQFLDAVPDGDQVSLIKMSDETHTGFVGLLKCVTLNPAIRSSIREVVNGFRFNMPGSPEDGSDGFTMTKCVIDAINVVGSNDLTFVYMLTDFEYWTHRYRYDMTMENWDSLASLLPESKTSGMCKYGIELNSGSNLHQDAIFKDKLDRVFGKVEYQSVGSASLLSNWFSHIASSVMSVKLNALLKSDWKKVDESISSMISLSGNDVVLTLDAANTPLANGAYITMRANNSCFNPMDSEGPFPGNVKVGKLLTPADQKTLLPGYRQLGGDKYEAQISIQSQYANEISRLQGVCGEVAGQGDAVNLKHLETGNLPTMKVWNSKLPIWLWVLILLITIVIIASFIYEYAFIKLNREWSVSIRVVSPDGSTARFNEDSLKAPFTFGASGSDFTVEDAPWSIKIFTKRHNPLTFMKNGYFLKLEQGGFADIETDYDDEPRTISVGESAFLCSPGKSTVVNIRINERGKSNYKISLD